MPSRFLVPSIDAGGGLPAGNLILNAPVSSTVYTGGGRTFNGSTQYFDRASHASHNLGTGDVLLSVMVLRNGTGNKPICAKYQNGTNYWQLEFTAGNVLHFIAVAGGATLIDVTSITAITSTTAWYHVLVAIDRSVASGCKIYVNNIDDTQTNQVSSVDNIDNTGVFWVGTGSNGSIYFPGTLSTLGIGKPTDVTTITTAAALSLFNFRNGKQYNDITAAERTDWNLTSYYDLTEISGDAIERVGAINLTDNNVITAGNGPAEAIAQDETANANHGQLIGFSAAQQITSWTPAVADGSYTVTVEDGQGSNDGTMTNFADVDAARSGNVPMGYLASVMDGQGSSDGLMTGFAAHDRYADVFALALVDESLLFDGADDYVNCGTIANFGTSNQTITAWIKPTSTIGATKHGIFSTMGGGTSGVIFALMDGGAGDKLYAEAYDGTNNPNGYSTTVLASNVAHHVAHNS